MAGEKNTFYLSGGDMGHSHIVGTMAKGKSRIVDQFMKEEAARRGIPLQELVLEIDKKLDEQRKLEKDDGQKMKDKRLEAVKVAYWEATTEEETLDLDDTLHRLMPEVDEFTFEQKKALFMMLPSGVIGLAIRWGLDDSEVQQEIFEFAERDLGNVRAAMGL